MTASLSWRSSSGAPHSTASGTAHVALVRTALVVVAVAVDIGGTFRGHAEGEGKGKEKEKEKKSQKKQGEGGVLVWGRRRKGEGLRPVLQEFQEEGWGQQLGLRGGRRKVVGHG